MKFGFVGSFGSVEQHVQLARECERCGWDGFFTWDAISLDEPGFETMATWDPFGVLAAAAAVTERITLGAMVFATPRHRPWEFAQRALTVDQLSGGRLVLPVGVGVANDRGFVSVPGQAFELRDKAVLLDDILAWLARAWSGETFTYDGTQLRTGEFQFPLPPVRGHIPVWPVAVWDATHPPLKSLRRALRWNGIVPQVRGESPEDAEAGPEEIRELVAWIQKQRGPDAGPFEVIAQGRLDADPAKAAAHARTMADAGATWWIESWWDPSSATPEGLIDKVRQGPPRL
ncbi:LLM class flavin-dependent oxidoreductase [Aldersonia kunmingensis]|uniref:LLM class flavin-dependent oxidoreductase n=1 Tax=Aldersonia kunmingensis TaxID=408066 RepID=UPI000831247D|nr:LLM class flavin-dependent oxidoreductase [Aldersonia kunmingensis]